MIEHEPEFHLPITTRRRFLEVMGASMALASSGCMPQPKETIVPYVRSPEETIPGNPKYFATSITLGGYATGVLVESHLGRPTKIEGNPDHPGSRGATDAFSQAAVLGLYDPDRSQAISHRGEVQTWQTLASALQNALTNEQQRRGAGIRILTETITSPALTAQLNELLAQYPDARWYQFEPINNDNAREGALQAFGQAFDMIYRFDRARVVLDIDADFLASGPGSLVYAREFMARRDPLQWDPVHLSANGVSANIREPNRLFVIEAMPSCSGTVADHRLALSPTQIEQAVHYLARQIISPTQSRTDSGISATVRKWLDVVARELIASGDQSAVVIGRSMSARAHALVHGINASLGNLGSTVQFIPAIAAGSRPQIQSIRELARELESGAVRLLVILGGNPAFTAPADLRMADKLKRAELSLHWSLYEDETSVLCDWHVPAAHELESWSDARAFDGTASIIQPLIGPLYEGKTIHEVVALLLGNVEASSYELVRNYWRTAWGEENFESRWYQALHNGLIDDAAAEDAALNELPLTEEFEQLLMEATRTSGSDRRSQGRIEVSFRPDPTIFDGRFANNGWLQELPKPITKLTWDNAALLSTNTARALGVDRGDLINIRTSTGEIELPVWTVPAHADECITVHLGYGRKRGGSLAAAAGANAYAIRSSRDMWLISDAQVQTTGRRTSLACTQHHQQVEPSDPAHWLNISDYRAHHRTRNNEHAHEHPTLYDPASQPIDDLDYAWGMSINLNTCIGCGACVVACQAENNIPVVGKEMVLRNREMHWLRIDTYVDQVEGGDNVIIHQPLACVHCENAPCEVVCPVGATVHSAEGLNEMVYNRCVGTRYCSHNCPYKVRRFNFFNYTDDYSPTLQLLQNPDVTVRMRGVMEKCTYCVQRINAARVAAKKEQRRIADGDVITACQAACPTRAIQFGDISDAASTVALNKQHPLNYGLLAELNTRPRSTYLARVTNPLAELMQGTEEQP